MSITIKNKVKIVLKNNFKIKERNRADINLNIPIFRKVCFISYLG